MIEEENAGPVVAAIFSWSDSMSVQSAVPLYIQDQAKVHEAFVNVIVLVDVY